MLDLEIVPEKYISTEKWQLILGKMKTKQTFREYGII